MGRKRGLGRWTVGFGAPVTGALAFVVLATVLLPSDPKRTQQQRLDISPGAPLQSVQTPPQQEEAPPEPRPRITAATAATAWQPPLAQPPATGDPSDGTSDPYVLAEQERAVELEAQQKNMFKRMIDAAAAHHGVDTTMLTVEEITGGRSLRGRAAYLARQRAGAGGAGSGKAEDPRTANGGASPASSEDRTGGGAPGTPQDGPDSGDFVEAETSTEEANQTAGLEGKELP